MTFVVRTSSDAVFDIGEARAAVASVDASLPLIGHGLLSERLDAALATPRFNGALLGAFGALALGLASIGMYGVLAFSVRRRTRELGIRVALGAGRGVLVGGVLADGFRLAGAGMAIGLVGALAAGRLLRALVWGIEPGDPLTLAMVLVVLAGATLLAAWMPAQRAASVDPVRSLQSD
jgi:ABC-type antimicrobial peptide transport system permease subunit